MHVEHLAWSDSGGLRILDQTRLPAEERWLEIADLDALVEALRSLRVRGAPAIGIAAAMGLVAALDDWAQLGRVRGAGQGFVYNFGRGLSALAPFAVGSLADTYGLGAALGLNSAFFLVAAALVFLLPDLMASRQAPSWIVIAPKDPAKGGVFDVGSSARKLELLSRFS